MVPRTDFNSRNLGTGRPTIQCTACGEYSHWRRECPYDNFCTTCNNHDHATHMCRAPKQTPQQSPATCVYCGSMEHSSSQCHNRPWDNREQQHVMPEASQEPGISMCQQQNFGKCRLPVIKCSRKGQSTTFPQVIQQNFGKYQFLLTK